MYKNIAVVGIITALSACGGGGGGGGPDTDFSGAERENQFRANEINRMVSDFEQRGLSPTAALPAAGSASYAGYLGFSEANFAVVGDARIGVNFTNNSVTGSATNFIDSDNFVYDGSLRLDNGTINRTPDIANPSQITGQMNGNISGTEGSITIQSRLEANFSGANQENIIGLVSGVASSSLDSSPFAIEGFLIAER